MNISKWSKEKYRWHMGMQGTHRAHIIRRPLWTQRIGMRQGEAVVKSEVREDSLNSRLASTIPRHVLYDFHFGFEITFVPRAELVWRAQTFPGVSATEPASEARQSWHAFGASNQSLPLHVTQPQPDKCYTQADIFSCWSFLIISLLVKYVTQGASQPQAKP